MLQPNAERARLYDWRQNKVPWHRWGPYLSARQWGTVREDYSPYGTAWEYFPHDHARSRAYRWGEDGILGICDNREQLCFAVALWNGADPILKERLFGLTGNEGNHGEDVKECYYYLDNTPSHAYMLGLYKYPQRAFPYNDLVEENRRRDRGQPEYELLDTGIFAEDRYFDVFVEYAKVEPEDLLIRISVTNHGPDPAPLHLLPTLWFRNTWSWGRDDRRPLLTALEPSIKASGQESGEAAGRDPSAADGAPRAARGRARRAAASESGDGAAPIAGGAEAVAGEPAAPPATAMRLVRASHHELGDYWLACEGAGRDTGSPAARNQTREAPQQSSGAERERAGTPALLFTENETNTQRLWGVPPRTPYVKDGIEAAVVHGQADAVNPAGTGTKVAAHYQLVVAPHETEIVTLRLSDRQLDAPFANAAELFAARKAEADEFYESYGASRMTEDERRVQRQAFAGLLWSKQFYHYDVRQWLEGDPAQPPPPPQRKQGRNHRWFHLDARDPLIMPDTWEYPWFAAWDLAFHCITMALVDPESAKRQLHTIGRVWYQHPNGQLPAYEWAFGDVNPPVHAWAAWRIYKIEKRVTGRTDRGFLVRVFHKLLLNFTWWVNRKDPDGLNVFEGGFLGLDNIGVFDRSAALPTGGHLEQSDGTAWMGMYCLNMLAIALELADQDRAYEDIAMKFFEHFMYVAGAMNNIAGSGIGLWDEEDSFFYDVLHLPNEQMVPLKVRSLVGLIPLFAIETIEPSLLQQMPRFKEHLEWFLNHHPDLASLVSRWYEPGAGERRLLALVRGHRMKCLLRRMLDPAEFLSDCGVRSVSKYHKEHPYVLNVGGMSYVVDYEPAESTSGLFGGNSNWRGPIWFPINFLIIESLQKFHHYYGDDFLVECPTGSGQKLTLWQIADHLSRRLIDLFLAGPDGRRPAFGTNPVLQTDPRWHDYLWFNEYFNGDTGAGLGASHQTGWTSLVAKLLEQTSAQRAGLLGKPLIDYIFES
jgi:hypothetical protein